MLDDLDHAEPIQEDESYGFEDVAENAQDSILHLVPICGPMEIQWNDDWPESF